MEQNQTTRYTKALNLVILHQASNVRQMKRKPTKLDECIKKRGLMAGQITLRKGIKNRVKKQGSSNVDLLGLEEWQ